MVGVAIGPRSIVLEKAHGGSFTASIAIDGQIPLACISERIRMIARDQLLITAAAPLAPTPAHARRLRPWSEPPFSYRKEVTMHASSHIDLHSFTVEIEFSSGGEPYATETYKVEATDWYRAQRDALEMSVSSPYDNVRIPDLTRRVITR